MLVSVFSITELRILYDNSTPTAGCGLRCVRIQKWTKEDSTPSLVIAMKVQTRMISFLLFSYIATLESGWKWARENKIIVPIPPRLILAYPRSQKHHQSSQFTFEKTSEWSSFNFSSRYLNFCSSFSISLEYTFSVLACARYREKSTRGKHRESPITNRHRLKI